MSAESNKDNEEMDPSAENQQETEATLEQEEESLLQAEDDLAEALNQAQKKAEENWEMLLRTKAEMDNLRRRTQKDLENAHKFALEKFVNELIPIIDGMEMGLSIEEATVDSMKQGMELTLNMMQSTFEKFEVVAIDPLNEKFNPELHQAMSMQPSAEHEPNTVIAVMQKGYTLNGRLVRPAMVMVSKAAPTEA